MIDIAASGQEPLSRDTSENQLPDETDDDQIGADESVASAYESMVWQDSADDGTDGGMLDVDLPAGATNPVVAVEEAADFLKNHCF